MALQLISFSTTYGGTRYYFSEIGSWIPIVLAAVIQVSIVAFSFSLDTKVRNPIPKRVVLSLAVVVSILFSYVGIVNSAIAPYDDITATYDNVYIEVTALKN